MKVPQVPMHQIYLINEISLFFFPPSFGKARGIYVCIFLKCHPVLSEWVSTQSVSIYCTVEFWKYFWSNVIHMLKLRLKGFTQSYSKLGNRADKVRDKEINAKKKSLQHSACPRRSGNYSTSLKRAFLAKSAWKAVNISDGIPPLACLLILADFYYSWGAVKNDPSHHRWLFLSR